MTGPQDARGTFSQPPLAELVHHYFQRRAALEADDPMMLDISEEVVPFDASALPPVDARRAWDEARAVAKFLGHDEGTTWAMVPDWATLVSAYEPAAAVAFALGNSPQLVRNLHALLGGGELESLRPGNVRAVPAPSLLAWAAKLESQSDYPSILRTLAALRVGRHFDLALNLVEKHGPGVPAEWRSLWANEMSALAWHRGAADEAFRGWEAQESSVPVLFNRGMALLFTDRPAEARPLLTNAVRQLADDDAWHHLGCLYLALADIRG